MFAMIAHNRVLKHAFSPFKQGRAVQSVQISDQGILHIHFSMVYLFAAEFGAHGVSLAIFPAPHIYFELLRNYLSSSQHPLAACSRRDLGSWRLLMAL